MRASGQSSANEKQDKKLKLARAFTTPKMIDGRTTAVRMRCGMKGQNGFMIRFTLRAVSLRPLAHPRQERPTPKHDSICRNANGMQHICSSELSQQPRQERHNGSSDASHCTDEAQREDLHVRRQQTHEHRLSAWVDGAEQEAQDGHRHCV